MSRMNTLIKSALLAACATFSAQPAVANGHDHTVYVYPDGFFPETIYAQWGDVIQYVNKTNGYQNMQIPYYYSPYYGSMYVFNFGFGSGGTKNVTVYPSGTFRVGNLDGSSGEDGFITRGEAPRQ